MITKLLFPNSWKPVGWLMAITGVILGLGPLFLDWQPAIFEWKVLALYKGDFGLLSSEGGPWFSVIENNVLDEIAAILIITGSLIAAFARVKDEDEFTAKLRLESLMWATYIHFFLLLFSVVFIYEAGFWFVMIFNMFTILLIFLIRFHWMLYQFKKSTAEVA